MQRFALAALLALCAAPVFADPLEGVWKTRTDDNGKYGYVRVAPCADKFCGTLVKAFVEGGGEDASPNIGKKIIWDMVAEDDGAYGGGKIWAPDRDKVYASKLRLSGDSLAVSGCVLGGLICRDGGTWTRVK